MAATPATQYFDQMALITANLGGAVQSLPKVDLVYGRRRSFTASLVLASQTVASGPFGVARLPVPCVITDITLVTDTSLGTSTIALGDAGNGNSGIYMAAQVLTATDTPTKVGKTAKLGVEITAGFDAVTGNATAYGSSSGFGAAYEDIIMTVAVATLPASGNLRILVEFVID